MMTMNAVTLEILLHHYYQVKTFEFSTPAKKEGLRRLLSLKFLHQGKDAISITPKGRAYVDACLSLPIPSTKWVVKGVTDA